MKSNKRPEIRFGGFSEDWAECRLGEVSERIRGNDGRMDLPTLTISAGSGWLDQRERFSGNIAGNEQKNYTLLSEGELSYNHGNSKLAKYGAVFVLRTYKEALVPRIYHSFRTNEKASSDFIESMFATKKPDKELAKLISSGARMDGLLNINYDEFMSIKITIPRVEEQIEIAKFLRNLENAIIFYQKELTSLKKTKQGFLQKMFPKEGEFVPELRFPGFTEGWEQRKLGEISKTTIGEFVIKTKQNPVNPFPVYNGGISPTGFYDEFNNKGPKILISARGANAGFVNFINGKYWAGNSCYSVGVIDNSEFHINFLYHFLKCNQHLFTEYQQAANIPSVSKKDVEKFEILYPSYNEQKKIGDFFNKLDIILSLHQQELDALKQTKKAFLQKMFI